MDLATGAATAVGLLGTTNTVNTTVFGAEPSHRDLATAIDPRGFDGDTNAVLLFDAVTGAVSVS